eukprot:3941855-Rhodomonas_salina.1
MMPDHKVYDRQGAGRKKTSQKAIKAKEAATASGDIIGYYSYGEVCWNETNNFRDGGGDEEEEELDGEDREEEDEERDDYDEEEEGGEGEDADNTADDEEEEKAMSQGSETHTRKQSRSRETA